ncbi:MAG: hypothetical protein E7456_06110 [Ruminococcaceae bacterium]|nr:hypothetical protein [Oscillospiraceae bacterium]
MKKNNLMRIIALILCVAMMMCLLASCKEEVVENEPEEETEETEETNDFTTLYEYIEPDEPVMKIGDVEISWGVLYYYFYQEASTLYAYNGEIYDWTAIYQDGMTYIEYCVNEAIYNNLRRIAGIEHFAKEYNVELTAEQKQTILEDKQADLELFETEEAMKEYMSQVYLDEETVMYLAEIEVLYENVMHEMVGENGEKLTFEQIKKLADTAYKSIKFVAIDKDSENALENAKIALSDMKFAGNKEAKLEELIDRYCDPEMAEEYKTGYVFTRGYFDDDAVEQAVREMEIGDLYDTVVEGEDYYYVLLRTEVDPEAYPYYGASETGVRWGEYTLRQLYSDDIFDQIFWGWADDTAELTFYDNITNMNIDEVLGWI